ncbi:MAG: hypothetical protein WD740_04085 [Anaerolineales bacterium]
MTTTAKPAAARRGSLDLTRLFLLFAFLAFLAAQLYLTAAPILSRSLPVEVDDAYSYILKAEEIRASCFFQDCSALEDLRTQFTDPTNDLDKAYVRAREYHRVFVVYHPLHSLALVGLNSIGLSYETGYSLLALAGKMMLCFGIAYWLITMFGQNAAAITLLLLTPAVFIGQGLHTIVPSNMALGLAFFAWGLALNPKHRVGRLLLPLLLAMLLLHQAGKVYGVLALVIYTFKSGRPFSRERRVTIGAGAFLILVSFLLPMVITHPEFNFNPASFYPVDWGFFSGFFDSLGFSWHVISVWFSAFAYAVVGATLVIVAYFALKPNQRTNWHLMFLLLFGLLMASLVYVVPWFGALFFERAWIPLAILLLGSIGQLVFRYFDMVWNLLKSVLSAVRNHKPFASRTHTQPILLAALLSPLLLLGLANYFPFYLRHYSLTLENQQLRQDFTLDRNQPLSIFGPDARPGLSVLYMSEIPFYYYLTYGGLNYNAVYFPSLEVPLDSETWKDRPVDFLVAANPVFQLSRDPDLAIVLHDSAMLEASCLSDFEFNSIELFIESQDQDATLILEWQNGGTALVTNVSIPAGSSKWFSFSQNEFQANKIRIRISNSTIHIKGLRFDSQGQTSWPWDVGILLQLTPGNGAPTSIEISETQLASGLPFDLEVLSDKGFSVLARVVH